VVGQGQRLHSEFVGALHQAVYPARSVEEAVVAMNMEVDEILVGRRHSVYEGSSYTGRARGKGCCGPFVTGLLPLK
jgi:hypothetical protein